MKHTTICIILAFAAALALVAMTGCNNNLKGELEDAVSNVPAFESVTVNETTRAVFLGDSETAEADEQSAESDSLETTTIYQFDASGDELKTSMTGQLDDIKIQYYSVGDEAVCVTDGPVYSGTTEQFDMEHFGGFEAYFEDTIGDLNTIVDCADTVSREQKDGVTIYALTLDPDKYIESDEILTMMAEYGDPVIEAACTIGFDQDGRIVSVDEFVAYKQSTSERFLTFSDFDCTVIDPMPKADRTYEEMEADMDEKLAALDEELDLTEDVEGEETASEPAEAK